ncbi:hypothetical protein VUR80DRAFT_7490 [Thermomyces stellatus]
MKLLSLLAPALAAAAPALNTENKSKRDLPDPSEIQILSATWSGNGCPENTVSTNISPDRTVITFGFDAFQTYIGPGVPVQERNKNCAIHLTLQYPGGYQFALVDTTYHGFALLEEGIVGDFVSTYFFSQDADALSITRTTIEGGGLWADGQVYTRRDEVPTASMIYSPCGAEGILNINNRIQLRNTGDNPDAYGSITDDDATVAFTQQLNINWRKCE